MLHRSAIARNLLRKDASDAAEEKTKKLFNSCHARIVSSAGHADSRARQHSYKL